MESTVSGDLDALETLRSSGWSCLVGTLSHPSPRTVAAVATCNNVPLSASLACVGQSLEGLAAELSSRTFWKCRPVTNMGGPCARLRDFSPCIARGASTSSVSATGSGICEMQGRLGDPLAQARALPTAAPRAFSERRVTLGPS